MLAIAKKHKILFVLSVVSLTSETLYVSVGDYKFLLASFISFNYFVLGYLNFSTSIKIAFFLWVEYLFVIIVGLYFLLISPWDDPFAYLRLWTQH
jgi:hypothetical protein